MTHIVSRYAGPLGHSVAVGSLPDPLRAAVALEFAGPSALRGAPPFATNPRWFVARANELGLDYSGSAIRELAFAGSGQSRLQAHDTGPAPTTRVSVAEVGRMAARAVPLMRLDRPATVVPKVVPKVRVNPAAEVSPGLQESSGAGHGAGLVWVLVLVLALALVLRGG